MAKVKDKLQYVFIHPSWRGAWCWDQVLLVMRAWGREAYAPGGPRSWFAAARNRARVSRRLSLGLLRIYPEGDPSLLHDSCGQVGVEVATFCRTKLGPISEAREPRSLRCEDSQLNGQGRSD